METKIIKKLSEFGEGFKHHHENYEAYSISQIRETGGVWDFGNLVFHFPEHFGFCYGVDKAIDMVFETCERFSGKNIFLTDQLIHNPYINGKLKERGVQYLKRDAQNLLLCDELNPADIVVVSAFGTDFRDIRKLKEKGVTVVDSTCGAIVNVWKRVEGYAKNGFITIMHGKRNHEETRATVSQAVKEGGTYIIVENKKEAGELAEVIRGKFKESEFIKKYPDAVSENLRLSFADGPATNRVGSAFGGKMGMANQTTMLKGESLEIQEVLRAAFRERFGQAPTAERFRSFDTICGATQDRQDALRGLLDKKLDLILIVGGFNSSNTTHLAEIASGKLPIYHIESAEDILSKDAIRARDPVTGAVREEKSWFPPHARNVGITSGASTPDIILQKVIEKIRIYVDII
ncbi:MAG: 4-hydroxy-3-methylbut-2-enyl diphosphate reductase [Omnitrophica bacterium RIFCSPHIGHO2_02_FULL_51_18]|nr:MAG: 4-hydroxy-3-methylbut-2-enyl diphosphate reductase [Omnitrophica bacterium RIFCSPHIGHO2_02_FULL_51_18]